MPLPNDDGTIVPASFTALAEQGAAVSGVVSASGDAPVILNYFWSMKKLMVRTSYKPLAWECICKSYRDVMRHYCRAVQ